MGSPAERQALDLAVARFRMYGCDTAYVMPFTVAAGVNTSSGVAVGVSRGTNGRIIVIGGHIDSSGPDIPGANDDGSGTAVVIELARVLSAEDHQSTLLFCCWGGEEQGLRGAQHFVDNFAAIDSVDLMLQIDMANGGRTLGPDPHAPRHGNAPGWLVEATYDIFYNELEYEGLKYEGVVMSLNDLAGGIFGSDHEAFLKKGIPAIDFTTDPTDPIHTPQDNLKNFDPTGLKRSGDLVYLLAKRFDGGVPSRSLERYMLLQVGDTPWFIRTWMLVVIIAVAVVLSVLVLLKLRRTQPIEEPRVRWSSLKILFFTLLVQMFAWLSEGAIGLMKGYRFPWVNNFGGFVMLGVLFGLLGFWMVLRLTGSLPISINPYKTYLRAWILFLVLIAAMALGSVQAAVFPALSLLFLVLSFLAANRIVRVVLAVVAVVPILQLTFLDQLGLLLRGFSNVPLDGIFPGLLYNLGFIVFFTLLSLPLAFGLTAAVRNWGNDARAICKFSKVGTLIALLLCIVAQSTYLLTTPVYGQEWYSNVRVEEKWDYGRDSSSIIISSPEYMNGLKAGILDIDTMFTGRVRSMEMKRGSASVSSWLTVQSTGSRPVRRDSASFVVDRTLELRMPFRPYAVRVVYSSDAPFTVSSSRWAVGGSPGMVRDSDRRKTLSWYSFPDSVLSVPVQLVLSDSQHVAETVEVTFDTIGVAATFEREFTNIRTRSTVTVMDTVRID